MTSSSRLQVDVDAHYPVDDITERTNCELHTPMRNISLKVAVGYVLPKESEANYLNGDIPPGYAHVGVDEVVPEFQTLDLEIPGGVTGHRNPPGIRKSWVITHENVQKWPKGRVLPMLLESCTGGHRASKSSRDSKIIGYNPRKRPKMVQFGISLNGVPPPCKFAR